MVCTEGHGPVSRGSVTLWELGHWAPGDKEVRERPGGWGLPHKHFLRGDPAEAWV